MHVDFVDLYNCSHFVRFACIGKFSMFNSEKTICKKDEVSCFDSPQCIPKSWMCDGYLDCDDETDELQTFCKGS